MEPLEAMPWGLGSTPHGSRKGEPRYEANDDQKTPGRRRTAPGMGRGWGTASSNSEARAQAAKDEHGDREQLWGHRHHHGSLEGTEEGSTTPDEVSS